jgi:hypothetical protein
MVWSRQTTDTPALSLSKWFRRKLGFQSPITSIYLLYNLIYIYSIYILILSPICTTDVLHFLSTPVLRPAPGPSPATGQFLSASRKISHVLGWQILYWSASPGRWFASFTRQCALGICKWGGLSDWDPLWYTQTAAFWWSPGFAALIFWSWSWLCEQVSRVLYTCTLFSRLQEARPVPPQPVRWCRAERCCVFAERHFPDVCGFLTRTSMGWSWSQRDPGYSRIR